MRRLFADAHYFIARLNPADSEHEKVILLTRQMRCEMVTTEWVLTEVADALSRPHLRKPAVEFFDLLAASRSVTIVSATHELFRAGMQLYSRRLDKEWPLTDCISFVTMKDFGITDALTADHHFEQAGFRALLK